MVGEQHLEILQGLLARFVVDDETGRQRLRPGAGGWVLLTGPSGSGKSRIVRELYRALRDRQSQPEYWPPLGPDQDADVPREAVGLAAFAYRKVLGPRDDFQWPPEAVPDFLWWTIECRRTSDKQYEDAIQLAADRLLQHQEPALLGWARSAAGDERWRRTSSDLFRQAMGAAREEGVSEGFAKMVEVVVGETVPFGGLALRGAKAAFKKSRSASERHERWAEETVLGHETGGRVHPVEPVLEFVRGLARPDFPLVVAVEDLHDADADTLSMLRSLCAPEFVDRVLIVSTAWPEGLSRAKDLPSDHTSLEAWLSAGGTATARIEALPLRAASELVLDAFPDTAPTTVAEIVERWKSPLALGLVLDLLARRGLGENRKITATKADIGRIPQGLQGLYDEQFSLLPSQVQIAIIMDVMMGADCATFEAIDQSPHSGAVFVPVQAEIVTRCADEASASLGVLDHDGARRLAWLDEITVGSGSSAEEGVSWLATREPGFAISAWKHLSEAGLERDATGVRKLVTQTLAGQINFACTHDGGPGLFLPGNRWWLLECSWMMHLAADRDVDPTVHDAVVRSSIELFRHRAHLRPQDAITAFAPWTPEWEKLLGPDHPDTLASRNNLAGAYRAAGDLGRAIPLYTQNLTDRERILGPNHPDTLASRNNLAYAYESAGDLGRAIPLYTQTLTDSERILGPDHPQTLTSRNNLAGAHESAGDLGRAIPLFTQTLTDRERILGPDHPQTLASRNNLAYAYESAGDLGRAIPLYTQTLTDTERILGPNHPQTLTSRNNLASAAMASEDFDRAQALLRQQATYLRRLRGPRDEETLACLHALASALWAVGRRHEARRVLGDATRTAYEALRAEHELTQGMLADYAAMTQALEGRDDPNDVR